MPGSQSAQKLPAQYFPSPHRQSPPVVVRELDGDCGEDPVAEAVGGAEPVEVPDAVAVSVAHTASAVAVQGCSVSAGHEVHVPAHAVAALAAEYLPAAQDVQAMEPARLE